MNTKRKSEEREERKEDPACHPQLLVLRLEGSLPIPRLVVMVKLLAVNELK